MTMSDGAVSVFGKPDGLRFEELAAQRAALWGRAISLSCIVPLVTVLTSWPGPVYVYGLLGLFLLNGIVAYRVALSERGRPWHQYAFVSIDFALLSFTLLYPNPLLPLDLPVQFNLRNGAFIFFFVILASLAYVYRPSLVLWGGLSAAASWSIGVIWILILPETVWQIPSDSTFESILPTYSLPTFVDIGVRVQEIVVFLIVAGLLALAVNRARRIALRQASLAQERANLARYFPHQTVDLLAARANPFTTPREHKAAVLFADLVAFTTWSERHSPAETIGLLRDVHGLLAQIVFRHGGTLDKFIGDGLMATFGTPEPGSRDASNAVTAALAMVDEFEDWRRSQDNDESDALQLALGVHYGPIVMGDIGSSDRLEFAVLGDTVNVASRLETATREFDCRCLLSGDLLDAAEAESKDALSRLQPRFGDRVKVTVRGRTGEVDVVVVG